MHLWSRGLGKEPVGRSWEKVNLTAPQGDRARRGAGRGGLFHQSRAERRPSGRVAQEQERDTGRPIPGSWPSVSDGTEEDHPPQKQGKRRCRLSEETMPWVHPRESAGPFPHPFRKRGGGRWFSAFRVFTAASLGKAWACEGRRRQTQRRTRGSSFLGPVRPAWLSPTRGKGRQGDPRPPLAQKLHEGRDFCGCGCCFGQGGAPGA